MKIPARTRFTLAELVVLVGCWENDGYETKDEYILELRNLLKVLNEEIDHLVVPDDEISV